MESQLNLGFKLICVLIVLMIANQIIGTVYGSWREGFRKDLLFAGLWKIFCLAVAYGSLALATHFASEYVPEANFLNGIIIEPIAKYFSKICSTLRSLLDDSAKETVEQKKKAVKDLQS